MAIFLLTIMFACVLSIITFYYKKKDNDLFSPTVIALVLLLVTNVPYLFTMSFDYSVLDPLIRWRINENELPYYVLLYLFILSISIVGLLIGLNWRIPNIISSKLPILLKSSSNNTYIFGSIISLLIGMVAYFYFIQSIGGIGIWLENLYKRTSLIAGNNYLLSLLTLLNMGVFLYIYSFNNYRNKTKYFTLIFLILFVSLILTSMGGRKPTLQFLVMCFLVWNFSVSKFIRIPIKTWLLIPLALLYIIIIPLIRTDGGIETISSNPSIFLTEMSEEVSSVTKSISYIDHYLLIIDHFKIENLWWGKSYIDLLYAPIPSSLISDKPPVDDGVYLRTIAEGVDAEPSMPFNDLFPSSWPPETIGIMYMNFWIPGVFIGMIILGTIYKISYLYMKKSNFTLFSILIYANIILNFHLSNLRIVQTLTDILLITIFLTIFLFFKKIFSSGQK